MADKILNKIYVKVWRQNSPKAKGRFETYTVENVSQGTSFLEMVDILNDQLILGGKDPIAFDHDCREGICGMCSLYINGHAHGPDTMVTTCQLHMRRFNEGQTITVEPWRVGAFPVIKDLIVDRTAFEKIRTVGGFFSVIQVAYPMEIQFQFCRMMLKRQWMLLLVSDVALVLQRVKTHLLCCLSQLKYHSLQNYLRVR